MNISKLTLGTVQLGLDYGINNKVGKPNIQQSLDILNYAYLNGINSFDTAQAYGESEYVIGKWIRDYKPENIFITTKLPSLCRSNIKTKDISRYLEEKTYLSLEKMNIERIDNILLHNYEDLGYFKEDILSGLIKLKENDLVKNIGVSVYEVTELEKAIQYGVDSVQIPSNIFDHRFINSNLFKTAKKNNILIFCRSIFLQGLMFMSSSDIPIHMTKIKKYLNKLEELSISKSISRHEIALNFFKQIEEIDSILVGVENVNQLQENLKYFNSNIKVDCDIINKLFSDIPIELIDPRKW